MLADLVDPVIGVDPDRDWITLAVVEAHTSGITAHGRFPATASGYVEAVEFVDAHSVGGDERWRSKGPPATGAGSYGGMATIINPVVHYRDLAAGGRFLVEAVGFTQHAAHQADDGPSRMSN